MSTKNQSKDATTRQSTLPTLTKNPGNLGDEFDLNNNATIKLRESLSQGHQSLLAQREVERKVEVEQNSTGLPVLPALPAALTKNELDRVNIYATPRRTSQLPPLTPASVKLKYDVAPSPRAVEGGC